MVSMSGLLQRCIAFTGDVDTVATIALAAGRAPLNSPRIYPAIASRAWKTTRMAGII
jgi:hypothetical protein